MGGAISDVASGIKGGFRSIFDSNDYAREQSAYTEVSDFAASLGLDVDERVLGPKAVGITFAITDNEWEDPRKQEQLTHLRYIYDVHRLKIDGRKDGEGNDAATLTRPLPADVAAKLEQSYEALIGSTLNTNSDGSPITPAVAMNLPPEYMTLMYMDNPEQPWGVPPVDPIVEGQVNDMLEQLRARGKDLPPLGEDGLPQMSPREFMEFHANQLCPEPPGMMAHLTELNALRSYSQYLDQLVSKPEFEQIGRQDQMQIRELKNRIDELVDPARTDYYDLFFTDGAFAAEIEDIKAKGRVLNAAQNVLDLMEKKDKTQEMKDNLFTGIQNAIWGFIGNLLGIDLGQQTEEERLITNDTTAEVQRTNYASETVNSLAQEHGIDTSQFPEALQGLLDTPISQLAASNPEGLVQLTQQMLTLGQPEVAGGMVGELYKANPARAATFIQGLQGQQQRDMVSALTGAAMGDPALLSVLVSQGASIPGLTAELNADLMPLVQSALQNNSLDALLPTLQALRPEDRQMLLNNLTPDQRIEMLGFLQENNMMTGLNLQSLGLTEDVLANYARTAGRTERELQELEELISQLVQQNVITQAVATNVQAAIQGARAGGAGLVPDGATQASITPPSNTPALTNQSALETGMTMQ